MESISSRCKQCLFTFFGNIGVIKIHCHINRLIQFFNVNIFIIFLCYFVAEYIESNTAMTDGMLTSCVKLGGLTPVDYVQKYELRVYKEGDVLLNVATLVEGNGNAACSKLEGILFTDYNNTPSCRKIKACKVMNPEEFGSECRLICYCESKPCNVHVMYDKHLQGQDDTVRICEITV